VRNYHRILALAPLIAASLPAGCGGRGQPDVASSKAEIVDVPPIQQELSKAVNEAELRYAPLSYDYDEDLLSMLDRIEAHLASGSSGPAPRFLPKLDEKEEMAHFRETIRRWEAKTGQKLRDVIDPLKAEVAKRKPGESPFYPEFHKRFSAALDDLIPIEVAEMRERRNRAIHAAARPLFDKYRDSNSELIKQLESELSNPQYALPPQAPPVAPPGEAKP